MKNDKINYSFLLLILLSNLFYSQKSKILIPFLEKNKWGFSDTLGVIKVKPFVDEMIPLFINEESKSRFKIKKNGRINIIDENLRNILPQNNSYQDVFVNVERSIDIYYVKKNNNLGVFYYTKEIIPTQYDIITMGSNKSFVVYKNYKRGLYNSKGKMIIPPVFNYIGSSQSESDYKNGKYAWRAIDSNNVEHKYFDIDIEKKKKNFDIPLPPPQNNNNFSQNTRVIDSLKNNHNKIEVLDWINIALINENGKWEAFDLIKQKLINNLKYDEIKYLTTIQGKHLFKIKNNSKYGISDSEGNNLLEISYDNIEIADWGIILIERNKRQGVFQRILSTYPNIEPKYLNIEKYYEIPVNKNWVFTLYKAKLENGNEIYVGENGIEYFRE